MNEYIRRLRPSAIERELEELFGVIGTPHPLDSLLDHVLEHLDELKQYADDHDVWKDR